MVAQVPSFCSGWAKVRVTRYKFRMWCMHGVPDGRLRRRVTSDAGPIHPRNWRS